MKNNVPIFFLVFLLAASVLFSYGVFKPLLSHAVLETGRGGDNGGDGGGGPAVPDLSAGSYLVNTNGVDTDTLSVAGGAPNTTAVLYYAGPNGASGNEAMCTGDASGGCQKTYGPWNSSAAGGWDFHVVMNGQSSNTIHIDFVAPRSAQLSVSPINFSLAQGSAESGSAIVQNVSSVPGSSFALAYASDSWIVIDSSPSSLGAGANGPLNFHIDNSKVPARGSASQTITGGIAVSADGSGSGTAVTGSPQTITVSYVIPPAGPVIHGTPSAVAGVPTNDFSVTGGTVPFTWSAPGGNPGNATGTSFVTTFSSLGNYTVKVTDANSQSSSMDVTVTNPPTCTATGTWDTKKTFCVGETTTWSVTSNPSGFEAWAQNISNRPTTANPYDTNLEDQVSESPYSTGITNYTQTYKYQSWDVGFYSQQIYDLKQGTKSICQTNNAWNNITVYPSNDPHCGGGGSGGNPPPVSGYPKLSISPSSLAVSPNDHATFSAYYLNQDASGNLTSTDVTNAASWSSSNTGVASPTLIRGDFIANSPGSTNVTAGYAGLTGSSAITVGSGGAGLNLRYSCVNNACVSDPQGKYGSASSCAAAGCGGGAGSGNGAGNGGSGVGVGGGSGGNGGGGNSAAPSCTFAASPSNILRSQRVTLSWKCGGATSCSIDNGVGAVNSVGGSVRVAPNTTTVYTLTCNGSGNALYQSPVQVNVRVPKVEEISP